MSGGPYLLKVTNDQAGLTRCRGLQLHFMFDQFFNLPHMSSLASLISSHSVCSSVSAHLNLGNFAEQHLLPLPVHLTQWDDFFVFFPLAVSDLSSLLAISETFSFLDR